MNQKKKCHEEVGRTYIFEKKPKLQAGGKPKVVKCKEEGIEDLYCLDYTYKDFNLTASDDHHINLYIY